MSDAQSLRGKAIDMGYETEFIFVQENKGRKGYQTIEATLQMGQIHYSHLETLMRKAKVPDKDRKIIDEVNDYERQEKRCFTADGNYTDTLKGMTDIELKAEINKLFRMSNKLDKRLCYIHRGNDSMNCYTDLCGDLLMVVSLKDLRTALIKEQARLVEAGEYETGYNRFDMALRMIDTFLDRKIWGAGQVKVLMWGH